MKVLHVIGEMGYGGAELLTAQLARRMVAAGDCVEVLVMGFHERAVVDALRANGVVVHTPGARLGSPGNVARIARLARRGFDVVHVHLFPALYWAAIARRFARRPRWIYTEHSTSNGRRRRPWLRHLERPVYRQYDGVSCISREAEESLRDWVPSLASRVIENGIDVARFRDAPGADRAAFAVGPGGRLVLMVGAFRTEKNQANLLRAFALLPAADMLLLAGDGPERAAAEALARELGIAARVRFLGVVHDVERLLKLADVYVLPSLFEGFGLSAVEAAAAGAPVVYAEVGGLAGLLAGAGWPCVPTAPASIAAAIEQAAAAGRDSPQVARAKAVADACSIDSTVRNYRDFYITDLHRSTP